MKMENRTQVNSYSTYFSELRLAELQRYAVRWASKYAEAIQSIVLYNYTPERLAAYKEIMPGFAVRYALIFELLPNIDVEMLRKLEIATEQGETIRSGYPDLFDNRFFTVYTDKPEEDYYKHWVIFLKKAGEGMPPGVMTNELYWVLYNAQINDKTDSDGLRLKARSNVPSTSLSPELFPKIDPIEFTQRAQEWIDNSPLIDEVHLYLGKGADKQFVLIFVTQDKKKLAASTFWTDSLILLQQDLLSIYRDSKDFNISKWQLFTLGFEEGLPVELIRPNHCWSLLRAPNEEVETKDSELELADERVLWIIYPDTTREVWLNDCFGQQRLLSKQYFNSINRSVFAFLHKNAQKIITLTYLLERGINLKNKPLHKVVAELGFKGKLKKLFFDVSKNDILFRKSITRKELNEANVPDSKEELYQLFFK